MSYHPALLLLVIFTLSEPVYAATSDQDLADLRQQLMSLLKRVETLEGENRELRQTVTENSAAPSEDRKSAGWVNSLKIGGDFRYRYENIDAEGTDTRERNRVRARVAITAKPTEDLEVGVGLATGSDDPVSTNQSLGGGGSSKDINLDLAYVKWSASPDLSLVAGKMKNPFFKPGGSGLLWDGDYRPEGLALSYDRDRFFLTSSITFLESDTKNANHRTVYGVQSGFKGAVGDGSLVAGVGYFQNGTKGREVFYGDADDFFGNTFTCTNPVTLTGCTYANDFNELELFAEYSTHVGEKPLVLFADLVRNQDADDLDTAWATGLILGKASSANTWELSYVFQEIEADSVLGLITDSDFAGGGANSKGHILRGAWAVNRNWVVGLTYFDNEQQIDLGTSRDYRRLQLDTAFKF